ncbi:polyprenyl glycosylphosphotransferase, partial [Mesorhizobium sp. M00.F.Ca.ET.149.01.1.1]
MNMNVRFINLPNQRHLLLQMRFQLAGGFAFAVLIPALIRSSVDPGVIYSSNMQITIVAVVIAHLTGYLLYRRIGTFPGVAAAGYILPTFALAYGLVFRTIFFL